MAESRTLADLAPALFRDDRHAVFPVFKMFRPLTLWVVIAAPNATPTYGELQDGDRLANNAVDLRRYGCPDDDRAHDFAASRLAAIRRLLEPEAA